MSSTEARYQGEHYHGIHAATVAPMGTDFQLDPDALRSHLAAVAGVQGIRGLLLNGHAGENFLLSAEEKHQVIETARETVSDNCLLIAGINAESSLNAAEEARDALAAEADAIMIFPPNSWSLGVDPGVVITHHRVILETTDLPAFLYQAPVGAGKLAYPPDLLAGLAQLPRVVGVKEGSWEVGAYEANRRIIKAHAPHVAVMASGDEHLFTSFVLGSEGSIVSLAVIIPEVIVALDRAVRDGQLGTAREAHQLIYPLAKAIYGMPPASFATARLKMCLKLLGRLPCEITRPPIGPLSPAEVTRLQEALAQVGLLKYRA